MVKVIVLNQTNLVAPNNYPLDPTSSDGKLTSSMNTPISGPSFNSRYIYNFPKPVVLKNSEISLQSVGVWISWYNVCGRDNSNYNNNIMYYRWVDGTLYDIVFPSGNYTFESLQCYMQWIFISRGHLLINTDGSFVYLIEMIRNPTYYTCNIIVYPTPVVLGTYTYPSNATWTIPGTPTTPQVYIPNYLATTNTAFTAGELVEMNALSGSFSNFGRLLGYISGKYPTTPSATTNVFNSQNVSVLDTISGFTIACSISNNAYSNPPRLLQTISFPKQTYDSYLEYQVSEYVWTEAYDGTHTSIQIDIADQYGNPIRLLDTNLILTLLIKDKNEEIVKTY